jgi:hypothetical protein
LKIYDEYFKEPCMKMSRFAITATFVAAFFALLVACDLSGNKRYALAYNGNSPTIGQVPVDSSEYKKGAAATVLGRGSLIKIDQGFSGWNSAADGTGTPYREGEAFIMGNANATLYADWDPLGYLQMLYFPNDATDGEAPIDAVHYAQNDSVTVQSPGSLVRTDFGFDCWNTAADGNGTDYAAASVFPMGSSGIALYAKWRPPTVTFDVGSGSPVAEIHSNEVLTFPVSSQAGMALEGWYTDDAIPVKVSFPLAIHEDRTLTAQWIPSTTGLAFTSVPGGYSVAQGTASAASVTIPAFWLGNPVVAIGDNAFSGYAGLTSVTIPSSVTSIGNSAFAGSSLTGLAIPDTVVALGSSLFSGCQQLVTAKLPAGLASVPDATFQNCVALTGVITLPDNVATIGVNAFAGSGLTALTISATVTTIGNSAFASSGLTAIDIPDTVTNLGSYAFYQCQQLSTAKLPNGLASVPYATFEGCVNLLDVSLPSSATYIEANAFKTCSMLTSIDLPDGLQAIGSSAFMNCSQLSSIDIPFAITSIPQRCFSGCVNLRIAISLPNIVSIGEEAFINSAITGLSLGPNLASIDAQGFYQCTGLLAMTVAAVTPPTMGDSAIFNLGGLMDLFVPSGSVGTYQTTPQWSDYSLHIKAMP